MNALRIVPRYSSDAADEALLAALRRSSAGQDAIREAAERNAAARKKLRSELDALIADAGKRLPKLRGEVESALQESQAARHLIVSGAATSNVAITEINGKIALAQAKAGAAQHKATAASFEFTSEHDRLERELRQTADPSIAAFGRELNDLWHTTRRTPLTPQTLATTVAGTKVEIASSNAKLIAARLSALRAAIATCEDLQLEPDVPDLAERLDALRSGLPKVE